MDEQPTQILSSEQRIRQAWFDAWRPPDRRPISQWCEEHVKLPHSALRHKFSLDAAPYLREPLDLLNSGLYDEYTAVSAVQGAKSTISEAFAAWAISEDPGPMMWNLQTNGDARDVADTRIWPIFESCEPVMRRLPHDRSRKRVLTVLFDSMFLLIQGADSKGNLQSKSIRYQINDEVWLWPEGHLDEARKRCTAFWNRVILNLSTGGVLDDQTDRAYKQGTMREWSFRCPKCGELQPFIWKQMKWDDTTKTRDSDGMWLYREVVKTVRYQCRNISCNHEIHDTPATRRQLNRSGEYITLNPNPVSRKYSCHWNAMAVEWISWATLVEEYLKAITSAKFGNLIPLQEFIQKRLAEPWEERGVEDRVTVPKSEYNMGDPWDAEFRRHLTVDVQEKCCFAIVRAWSDNGGKSRLISARKLEGPNDLDAVREMQLEFNVTDRCVLIDCRHRTREVYFYCCRYRWTAVQGDDRAFFMRTHPDGTKTRSPVSDVSKGDPLLGAHHERFNTNLMVLRYCRVISWSNPTVMDILEHHYRGRGPSWEIPRDTPKEWHEHMESVVKRVKYMKETGKPIVQWIKIGKRQDHFRDCECEQIVAAVLGGLLGDASPPESEEGQVESSSKSQAS